jgi:hypothetical protein
VTPCRTIDWVPWIQIADYELPVGFPVRWAGVSQKGQFGALLGSGRRRAVSWARPNLRDCPYFGAFSAVWFSSSQVGGARRAGLVAYLGKRHARMTLTRTRRSSRRTSSGRLGGR